MPEDHPDEVPDDATLLRCIRSDLHLTPTHDGGVRLNSTAFGPSSDGSGTSIVIQEKMAGGRTPEDALVRYRSEDEQGRAAYDDLARVGAGETRCSTEVLSREKHGAQVDERLGVTHEATANEEAHGEITWPDLTEGAAHLVRRALSKRAVLFGLSSGS